MRKYLLPSALILALGLGLALAQNITKSLQLNQSASGAFGVDASNNVFFPAHILSFGKAPTIGNGCTLTAGGSDAIGHLTWGSSSTGCTITFAQAYGAAPTCVVSSQTAATPVGYTTGTSSMTFTSVSATGLLVNYFCSGSQ